MLKCTDKVIHSLQKGLNHTLLSVSKVHIVKLNVKGCSTKSKEHWNLLGNLGSKFQFKVCMMGIIVCIQKSSNKIITEFIINIKT